MTFFNGKGKDNDPTIVLTFSKIYYNTAAKNNLPMLPENIYVFLYLYSTYNFKEY